MLKRSTAAAAAIAAAFLVAAGPAQGQEQGLGPSVCREFPIGQFVSFVAQEVGHSGTLNPGNAHNPFPPFVPFIVGCNPTTEP